MSAKHWLLGTRPAINDDDEATVGAAAAVLNDESPAQPLHLVLVATGVLHSGGASAEKRLGGWYGYRASKAALNMMLHTAAIELRRSHPGAVLVALHPGTVRSALSRPFGGADIGRDAPQATAQMLATLDQLHSDDSGAFVAYDGQRLPW